MKGKRIAVTIRLILFCVVFVTNAFAQHAGILTGIVRDVKTNAPIPFVNISIQKTAHGTTTDANGRFEIRVSDLAHSTMVFSHVGYLKTSIKADSGTTGKPLTIYMISKVFELQQVVVSASLYEQQLYKLSKPAAIITHRQIADNMTSNVIDVLSMTPGFTQIWEYHSPLLLRGMNSKRLIVMLNGDRRIGTFPGGYFAQDMNIYNSQKIEIIKGPGSVIYGSGAISGIINVINKPPFGRKKTSVKTLTGYGSNNNEFLQVARLCLQDDQYGFSMNAKYRKTGDMLYGGGDVAENSNLEDRDMSLTAGYRFSDQHQVTLSADYHYGDWGKPRGFNGPAKYFTKIRNAEERLHSAVNYTYSSGDFVEAIKLNLYYDAGTRDYHKYTYSTVSAKLTSLELVHYKDNYGGGQLFTVLKLSDNNKLTTGVDGYAFQLDNPAEYTDYYADTKGTLPGYSDAGQQNIGAFLNDEWELTNRLRFIAGIRYDAARVNEGESSGSVEERTESRTAMSGNAGLVYSLNQNAHFSVNLGRAFRMPSAEELFTEVISCKGVKIGNPDLQPEYSWGLDVGFRGVTSQENLRYDVALFYDHLDDYINEAPADDIPDVDFTYLNTDARIMGGEFSAVYRFGAILTAMDDLYVGLSGAYTYGVDLSAAEDDAPLFGIPPFKLTCDLKYRGFINRHWLTGYTVKLQAEYATAQDRIAHIPEGSDGGPWGYIASDSHVVFNAMLALNSNALPGLPKLRIIVKNMFDLEYEPFGSYIPAMGRNIKTVLEFDI